MTTEEYCKLKREEYERLQPAMTFPMWLCDELFKANELLASLQGQVIDLELKQYEIASLSWDACKDYEDQVRSSFGTANKPWRDDKETFIANLFEK